MTRSHPATLLTIVARTLREECEVTPGQRLLLALSGGPDSMVLLHALASLREEFGYVLFAHGIDHGLREAARDELQLAADFARALGIAFECERVSVAPGGNLHARAREARLGALERAQTRLGCDYLATAHHADDRAETVLIRLLSGSGVKGLAVLPARAGNRLRPMIRARRAQVLAHLERHRVPSSDDPSNRDARFLRSRVRHEVMPLLEAISPGIVGHLLALSDELGAAPLPPVLDDVGQPVALRRAHREQLRRALRHRTTRARVLIGDGRAIRVDEGALRLEPEHPPRQKEKK